MKNFKSIFLSILTLCLIVIFSFNTKEVSANEGCESCLPYSPTMCQEGGTFWAACETPDVNGPCMRIETCDSKKPN